MARGWESKGVEEQQTVSDIPILKSEDEDPELKKKRDGLVLSRKRIVRELAETDSDVRRKNLEAALAHLDRELAKLAPR
jgi:hypothetical protein